MKRVLAALLAVFCLLPGCKSKNTPPQQADISTDGARTPLELTLGLWEIPGSWEDEATAQLVKVVKDKFNVTLVPYDMSVLNYAPEQAVAAPLPDMMTYPIEEYQYIFYSLVDMRRIRDIPYALYANYPALSAVMASVVDYTAWEGKQYFVPRTAYARQADGASSMVLYYRRDWLTAMGMEPFDTRPPTWDEFMGLLKAYTLNDPNKNGAADTWGITAYGEGFGSLYEVFLMPFGVRDWVIEDNRWIPGYLSARCKEAMKWLNQAYRQGYIDRDFQAHSMAEAIDAFCVGRAGMLALPATYDAVQMLEARWQELQPEGDIRQAITVLPQPLSPYGTAYNETAAIQGGVVFSSSLSDADLRRALEVLNWLYTPQGVMAANYGVAGVDYTTVDGKPQSVYVDSQGNPVRLSRRSESMKVLSTLATYAQDGVAPELYTDYQDYCLQMAGYFYWPNTWRRAMFTDYLLLPEISGYRPRGEAQRTAAQFALYSADVDEGWEAYAQALAAQIELEALSQEVNGYAVARGISTEE